MPDFDIDFCQDGRDRVIDYVKQKYGADSVSQIATFGTMAAKAAVRDVGRVLDLPYTFVDGIAKLIPFQPGKLITLQGRRATMEPLLAEREKNEEEVRELLELAEALEGLHAQRRHARGRRADRAGQAHRLLPAVHAARRRRDRLAVRQGRRRGGRPREVRLPRPHDADDPRLDAALRARARSRRRRSTLETLPLDDKAAYDIFRTANTTAVFQFESRGMRDLMKQAPPTRFEDIIALVALYRPGPMELIPDYIARKTGRERVEYPRSAARADPRARPTA